MVDDTSGHIAGEEPLKQLSALRALNLRNTDTFAGLSGDEFGVLLENCGGDTALGIAEKTTAGGLGPALRVTRHGVADNANR